MTIDIPDDLPVVVEQRRHEEGRRWLERLPSLLGAAATRWDLELGPPFRGGSAAWAGPVRRRTDGLRCVLKVTLPHREARFEGAGLALWGGEGAVRLIDAHDDDFALLIEECLPGSTLLDHPAPPEERLALAAGVLRRLWSVPVPNDAPFERVADVCADWAELVRRRMEEHRPPLDSGLVEVGATLLESLPASATRSVLVHGDFNPTNLLRSEREPWLAIDAKPMIGDPGYDPLSLVLQVGDPVADGLVLPRYTLVAEVLAEPVERLLAWSVARLVESALWHVSRGEDPLRTMGQARVLAEVAGL
ncbi:MAG TPA: aminoglycoside phosphotransferase family protein [Acidimicrobiales bacterium]|nr:aminoglycoside phosphotransferase family protein [Acidimicrobiales bacterium]